MIGLIIIWTIAFFLAYLLQCLPISESWNSLHPAPGHCIDGSMMYQAEAWSDIFTDLMILSMPLPWVGTLSLTLDILSNLMRSSWPTNINLCRSGSRVVQHQVLHHQIQQ